MKRLNQAIKKSKKIVSIRFNRCRCQKGSFYVELLVAIFILSLALMPLSNLFQTSKAYTVNTADIQLALRLTQEKIDEYRAVSYAELKNLMQGASEIVCENGPIKDQTPAYSSGGYDADILKMAVNFKRKVSIRYLSSASQIDREKISIFVQVWWHQDANPKPGNEQRYVEVATVVCNDFVF